MTARQSPIRILVRMPNWLGDCVMAMPVLASLKDTYPGAVVDIAINESLAGLGELAPFIDSVTPLPQDDPAARKRAFAQIRGAGYDTLLLLPNSFRSAWELWTYAIPERIGYATSLRSFMLTTAIPRPPRHSLHQTEHFLWLAESAFPGLKHAEVKLDVPEAAARRAAELLPESGKPLVGVGFGATYGAAKMWPAQRFAELIDRLSDEAQVVLVGAASDAEVEREVMKHVRSAPVSLVGQTNLPELAAVLRRLGVYITNDTGPMHLATALGAPVVAIFGPTSPEETKPLGGKLEMLYKDADCAPCWKRACPEDHRCMTAITVDEVEAAAREIMEH